MKKVFAVLGLMVFFSAITYLLASVNAHNWNPMEYDKDSIEGFTIGIILSNVILPIYSILMSAVIDMD